MSSFEGCAGSHANIYIGPLIVHCNNLLLQCDIAASWMGRRDHKLSDRVEQRALRCADQQATPAGLSSAECKRRTI